jgi:hypothetical protein
MSNIVELKTQAKIAGIKGFSTMKKAELVLALEIHQFKEEFEESMYDLIVKVAPKKAIGMEIDHISSIKEVSEHADITCSNKWLTVGFIAKGGFGKVYLAKHHIMDNWVAIKEIYFQNPVDTRTQSQETTLEEINTVQHFSTVDVAPVVRDIWKTPDTICFATDVMVNTLGNIVQSRTLNDAESEDLASLFHAIACKYTLYTDIRPENIMVDGDGNFKIADWGTNGWEIHSPDIKTIKIYNNHFMLNAVGGRLAGQYLKLVAQQISKDEIKKADMYTVAEWLNENIFIPKIAQALHSMSSTDRKATLKIINEENEDEDLDMDLVMSELDKVKSGAVKVEKTNDYNDVRLILASLMMFDCLLSIFWVSQIRPENLTAFFVTTVSSLDGSSIKNVWNCTGRKFTNQDDRVSLDEYWGDNGTYYWPKGISKWVVDVFTSITSDRELLQEISEVQMHDDV